MDPRKQAPRRSPNKLPEGLDFLEFERSPDPGADGAADDTPTIPNARLNWSDVVLNTGSRPCPPTLTISPEAVTEVFRTIPNLQPLFVDPLWGKPVADAPPADAADRDSSDDLTSRQYPPVVLKDPADPRVGQVFGKFQLVRRIGSGGMGEVYAAQHCEINTQAAVKILSPQMACRPECRERFLNEARAVNQIQHPGLVKIFDHGQCPDGTLYIIMELLEGESLYQRLKRNNGPLASVEAAEIARRRAAIRAW